MAAAISLFLNRLYYTLLLVLHSCREPEHVQQKSQDPPSLHTILEVICTGVGWIWERPHSAVSKELCSGTCVHGTVSILIRHSFSYTNCPETPSLISYWDTSEANKLYATIQQLPQHEPSPSGACAMVTPRAPYRCV